MDRKFHLGLGAVGALALALACGQNTHQTPVAPSLAGLIDTAAGPGGVTLKVSAPTAQTPAGGVEVQSRNPTFTLANAKGTYQNAPFTYCFQVLDASKNVLEQGKVSAGGTTTSWTMTKGLGINLAYTWRARAEYQTSFGPWSAEASFKSPKGGWKNGADVFDPLFTGNSVGDVGGGHFIVGEGWHADSRFDYINYDIPTTDAATLEFDVLGVDMDLPGPPWDIGLKFYAMGDGSQWDFPGFRNQPFKASLDKKSGHDYPGESGVVEHIFRTIDDDNRTKTGENHFDDQHWYHIYLKWGNGHVLSKIDDMVIADENYYNDYKPANHRVSLGCLPRSETLWNVTYRNVRITPGL